MSHESCAVQGAGGVTNQTLEVDFRDIFWFGFFLESPNRRYMLYISESGQGVSTWNSTNAYVLAQKMLSGLKS